MTDASARRDQATPSAAPCPEEAHLDAVIAPSPRPSEVRAWNPGTGDGPERQRPRWLCAFAPQKPPRTAALRFMGMGFDLPKIFASSPQPSPPSGEEREKTRTATSGARPEGASEKILVIRLTAIGDVVLTLPAVSVLRHNFPKAQITFLTTKENSSLLLGFREVNKIIAVDRNRMRGNNFLRSAGEILRLLRQLRREKITLAVDLQGNGESAWLTRLTGAAQRWGVVHKAGRSWAYTLSRNREKDVHAAEMHLNLLRAGGLDSEKVRNEFFLPADALASARDFLAAKGFGPKKPLLFLQPLTSSPRKNWPLANYLALAKHYQSLGWQVLFGGGPADGPALEPVIAAGFVHAAGVPLLVTGGLMQLATLIVGGDTGALHLAVAQGKRVVMLMNHDRPGRPHPFRHIEWSLLPPVDRDITTIKMESVMAMCERALE